MPDTDPTRPPDNFSIRRADHVETLKHLNPEGALSGLNLEDHEGPAIRAALDVWALSLSPPRAGNAAIQAARLWATDRVQMGNIVPYADASDPPFTRRVFCCLEPEPCPSMRPFRGWRLLARSSRGR